METLPHKPGGTGDSGESFSFSQLLLRTNNTFQCMLFIVNLNLLLSYQQKLKGVDEFSKCYTVL